MLLPFRTDLQYIDDVGEQLYHERRDMLALDNYNLLYVTLTRAIEQLYIITENRITKKLEENTNYYSGLFINYLKNKSIWQPEQLIYTFGEKSRVIVEKVSESTVDTIASKEFISTDLSEHQVIFYANSSLLWDTEQGKAISYGNLIHEILAQIKTADDIELVLQSFLNQGVISETDLPSIREPIEAVVSHSDLNDYFQHNLNIYNEREIVNAKGISIIPDRVVVLPEKKAVIIDYKTGLKEKKHEDQIENYGRYLSEMGYEVIKKMLVYIDDKIDVVKV